MRRAGRSLPGPASAADDSILETFRSKLRTEWTLEPKGGPHFIRTAPLKRWMKAKENDESKTNVNRLLDQVKPILTKFWDPIHEDKTRGLLVFSILLEQGIGYLIYIFQEARIIDERLSSLNDPLKNLKEVLERYRSEDRRIEDPTTLKIDRRIAEFERDKWAYYPAHLELGMDKVFESQIRLPFCASAEVNKTGGTASVFQVTVHQEFVSDEIKKCLGRPFEVKDYGDVSTMDPICFIKDVI